MIIQVLIIFAGVSNYFAHPTEPSMVLDTWRLSVVIHLLAFINSYPLPLLSITKTLILCSLSLRFRICKLHIISWIKILCK